MLIGCETLQVLKRTLCFGPPQLSMDLKTQATLLAGLPARSVLEACR